MPETSLKNVISYEEYIKDGDENYDWPELDDDADTEDPFPFCFFQQG